MTITQLRYFAAIVDAGLNITIAAKRMHGTQSGLSKQIRQLEEELGFLLFSRRARSLVALTPEGKRVLEQVRPLLVHARNIRELSANLRRDSQGELHIATSHTQARHVLPVALSRLKQKFPDVVVHLAPGGNAASLGQLKNDEADVAIISTGNRPPEAEIALPLFRWERVVVVPTGHPLTRLSRALRLSDLASLPLVSYESSRERESSLRIAFEEQGLEPTIALTARDADLIKTYVRTGHGVGVLAEMAVGAAEDGLVALSADALFATCTTWAVLRRDRLPRDYTLAFIGELLPHVHPLDLRELAAGSKPYCGAVPHWREAHYLSAAARGATLEGVVIDTVAGAAALN
jgi:LysR family cys regulon transcriptional activator